MAPDIVTGVVALIGAVVGGSFTVIGQRAQDARSRHRDNWTDQRKYVAALRLIVHDLERSLERLQRVEDGDPRGFAELPRGAWLEYRGLLAPNVDRVTLEALTDTYRSIIEWNEILWATFAKSPPNVYHGSDQNQLSRTDAAGLLSGMHEQLKSSVQTTADIVGGVCDREGAKTEADIRRPASELPIRSAFP